MGKYPESGTDSAIYATFRVIAVEKNSSLKGLPGNNGSVMLEPFNLPGMVVSRQGESNDLVIRASNGNKSSIFNLVKGLDGNPTTVSLESESLKGCYVTKDKSSGGIRLGCAKYFQGDTEFKSASSFSMNGGLTSYNPTSFITRGADRNFVLSPLFSLRDESYTVYFNFIKT